MKSIRLSLLAYFLLLLAATLGIVSWLVYETTQQTLQNRVQQALDRETLQARYNKRLQEEQSKLDNQLMARARQLTWVVSNQLGPSRVRYPELMTLGLFSASVNTSAPATLAAYGVGFGRGSLGERALRNSTFLRIQFDEDALHLPGQAGGVQYFQVNGDWGQVWASKSLGENLLPFDSAEAAAMGMFDSWYGFAKLTSGESVRIGSFKAPFNRLAFLPRHSGGRGSGTGPTPGPGPGTAPGTPPAPGRAGRAPVELPRPPDPSVDFLVIQFATPTAQLDQALGDIHSALDEDLADLERSSDKTLADLKNRLWAIGLAAFVATALGGSWLVWWGLLPLHRLSDAVSRISARDFRLPLDKNKRLPTELRPIVERLTETLGLLQRTFAREKQAAADISHELRTPLSALLTTLDVALRKPRSAQEYRELLTECRESGQQMNQLVERLLTLARLDAGVDHLRPQELDAAGLAEQCLNLVRPLAEARGLTLRGHHDKPAFVTADPNKLREVVTNLLHNAIQYNRPEGSIDLTIGRQNGHLEIEVTDTGIGIGPEARDHLFERFYRADPSRHADELHAGLGLAIVKGYVDLMGGHIEIDSVEGQGSTFRVELPVDQGKTKLLRN